MSLMKTNHLSSERDKFLTEAMGECWHDWCVVEDTPPFRKYRCGRCDIERINPEGYDDFSTWSGFGKLWEWAIEQDWWYEKTHTMKVNDYKKLINPERLAETVYEFLKG